MTGKKVIKFSDGQKLRRVEETTNLGHQITEGMDVKHEIQHKMQQTLRPWLKLKKFWTAIICSMKWRLQAYHAIIRSKPLYGLETVHLTQSLPRKMKVFHLRGLRTILGLSTTFINRAITNEFVLQKANEAMDVRPGDPPVIQFFLSYWEL